jgi:hypothetical protein
LIVSLPIIQAARSGWNEVIGSFPEGISVVIKNCARWRGKSLVNPSRACAQEPFIVDEPDQI